MNLFTIQSNPDAVTYRMLRHFGKIVFQDQLTKELNSHPDYPHLLAVSDVLKDFGLNNIAYQVEVEDLLSIPLPFIAHTRKKGSEYMLITEATNQYFVESKGMWRSKISHKQFKEIFDGVILLSEAASSKIGLLDNLKVQVRKNFYFIILLSFVSLCIAQIFFYSDFTWSGNWLMISIAFVKTLGLCTAIMLLIQSINNKNPLIKMLCGGAKANCNAILNSEAAMVFEGLSWSEVGFFYFAGTWLTLMLCKGSMVSIYALILLNLLTLPYTFYSIYYQWRVAKQWCLLCCSIQASLWLEFFFLSPFWKPYFPVMSGAELPLIAFCLLCPMLLWILAKPIIVQLQQTKPLEQQLRRFKYNSKVFNYLMADQPKYEHPDVSWSIVLGNIASDIVITIVSDPYCMPCSKAHQQLNELLQKKKDVQFRIVFTADNSDTDRKTPVVRHLMALNKKCDKNLVINALHDWYSQKQKNFELWAGRHPVQVDNSDFQKINSQMAWCNKLRIKATPTFMVNGSRLPEMYQLQDMKYLLQ